MEILSTDIVPITSARARLTELAADVIASGQPKVLTRNGESYVAVIGVADLDELHRLRATEHVRNLHLVTQGLEELESGGASVAKFRRRAEALATKVARGPATGTRKRKRPAAIRNK